MTTAKAARPHYLPASLIGGFGKPDTGRHAGQLRYAWVCVRRTGDPGTVAKVRADNVAVQNGLYDVAEPGPDLPGDFAEQLRRQYEGALPGAIRALENGSCTRDDWRTVLLHVQAQSIRHPDFARAVHEHLGEAAAAELGPDDIQAERQRTYQDTRASMARARFAVQQDPPRICPDSRGTTRSARTTSGAPGISTLVRLRLALSGQVPDRVASLQA